MSAVIRVIIVALLLFMPSSSLASIEQALRIGIGTNPLPGENGGQPAPVGAVFAFDIQWDGGLVAISPYAEYYSWSEESRTYTGAHALLTKDVTRGGVYGGLGVGVLRLRYSHDDSSSYAPTFDVVLGGRNTVSSSVALFGEGKLTFHRKWFPEDLDPIGEILLSLGVVFAL